VITIELKAATREVAIEWLESLVIDLKGGAKFQFETKTNGTTCTVNLNDDEGDDRPSVPDREGKLAILNYERNRLNDKILEVDKALVTFKNNPTLEPEADEWIEFMDRIK